jgi:hypothetical protein
MKKLKWWWCGDETCDCNQPVVVMVEDGYEIDQGLIVSGPYSEDWDKLEESARRLCERHGIEYVLSPREMFQQGIE